MSWDDYLPPTVPSGTYTAEIRSDPVEKASQFKPGTTYKSVTLWLRGQDGIHYVMEWAYSPKMPIYKSLLLILGGREQPGGNVTVPFPMVGRKFVATIIERPAKNDKAKLVNEITRVTFYDEPPTRKPPASPAEPQGTVDEAAEEETGIPF
jgi:hypothetical protein